MSGSIAGPPIRPTDAETIARRFASNSLFLLFGQGLNTVLSAVVAVFLIRYLGREEYGLLTTTYAYVSFFVLLTSVGIDTIVQRDVSRAPDRAGEIVGDAASLRLALGVGSMVLAWLLLPVLGPTPRLAFLVVLVSLSLPFSLYSLYLVRYAVELRMGRPKMVFAGWAVAASASKLAFIVFAFPLEAFAAMETVSAGVTFLLARRLGRRSGLRIRFKSSPGRWKAILAEAWPIALTLTFIQVYLRIDQVMLYRMVGADEVGLYGAAVRVAEFGTVLGSVFISSVFPLLSRLWVESEARLARATGLSFRALSWISVPLAFYLFVYAGPILDLLFGAEFEPAAPTLRVMAFAVPFMFVNALLYNRLFSSGDQRPAAILAAITAALNVGLNLPLIGQMGGRGAAIATAISYGIVPVLGLARAPVRDLSVLAFRGLAPATAGAVAAAAAATLLDLGLVIGGVVGTLVFGGVLILLREWTRKEWDLVRRASSRGGAGDP